MFLNIGLKILGAASEDGMDFEECLSLGQAVNSNLVTIGASLNFCHVLGRLNHDKIPEDVCVLGMGIHNEPVRILFIFFSSFLRTSC